jgi:sec-independent protein translocase protein TatA
MELLLVLGVVLLLFGPKRLPQLGKSLGKTVKAIREGVDSDEEDDDASAPAETSDSDSEE